ncbi:MAG: septum formation initiator family protein [Flavobacteriales bacterium]|nr:septum formation initiator family protein [Flavobacteriales bacterium]
MNQRILDRIPHWLRNRYAASALFLLGWITLFADQDLYSTLKLRHELAKMRRQHAWYKTEIGKTREQLHELTSNTALLEKFAREKYLMKRDNEDIFVFVPER